MTAHTDHPLRHYDRTCPACQGINEMHYLLAGHPMALVRYREMVAIVEAAAAFFVKQRVSDSYGAELEAMKRALKAGGFLP